MNSKCYIKYSVKHEDGYEISVTEVINSDSTHISNMFDTFLDFLKSMSFSEETISKTLREYAEEY